MKRFNKLTKEITENIEKDNENSENNKRVKNNNKFIINISIFILILIMSFGILFFYPKIKIISNNERKTPYEDYNLLSNIHDCNFLLYKDIVEKQNGAEKSLEEIYIKPYNGNYINENYKIESNNDYNERKNYEEGVLNPLQSRLYDLQKN